MPNYEYEEERALEVEVARQYEQDQYDMWIEERYWQRRMEVQQEIEEFPLFYWRDTCAPILNIKTGETT